ncbi:hypothetical protein Ddc_22431 [Ditylenchus destructor]|nr:hypothetical protein Ddc_22431 [Ditylenchus destructor]
MWAENGEATKAEIQMRAQRSLFGRTDRETSLHSTIETYYFVGRILYQIDFLTGYKSKDNQIREMNDKLKEQETKLLLSGKLNGELAAEKNAAEANARAIIKNAEQILAPIKAAKEGPASKQSTLKRHFEVNYFNKQATAVNSQIYLSRWGLK